SDHAQIEPSGGRRASPRTGGGGAVLTGSRVAPSLIRDQEILGKRPFRIDPLRFAKESRPSSETRNLFNAELVAGFRPDRFPFIQGKAEIRGANRDGLVLGRAEMHFDPTVHLLIPHLMFEVP